MMFREGVQRLFEVIAAINIQTTRQTQRVLKKHELTYPQFGALLVLLRRQGIQQKELADILNTDPTTAMVICEGLEEKGFIERTRDPEDRRAYRLSLTSAGKEAVIRANPEVESVFAPLAAMISEEEAAAILSVLERILKMISQG